MPPGPVRWSVLQSVRSLVAHHRLRTAMVTTKTAARRTPTRIPTTVENATYRAAQTMFLRPHAPAANAVAGAKAGGQIVTTTNGRMVARPISARMSLTVEDAPDRAAQTMFLRPHVPAANALARAKAGGEIATTTNCTTAARPISTMTPTTAALVKNLV